MSKEVIKPSQFANVTLLEHDFSELNEAQKNELNALYDATLSQLQPGQLLKGKVLATDSHGVLVDISYKSNGLIPRYEFTEKELKQFVTGSEIDVLLDQLENVDGNVILSYEKAKSQKAWEQITKLFEEGKPVEGYVSHTVKGGLSVDIGIPAFLPGSQVDLHRITDFNQFVGQTVTAYILKINKKRGNVIVSRRKFLSEQRSEARRRVMDDLHENQIIQGTVKNITNYGVFIDIGGVDGLLHITDMTWGRIAHPSEIVRIGQPVTVKVLSIDKENSKISLGMKQLSDNPWQNVDNAVTVGSRVKGKVSSITDYGLFVEMQKGVEGLVHISEISWIDRINDLSKHYHVGDDVEVLVVSMDKENRRMSLSIKQLDEDPWKSISERYHVGDKIKGKITNITDFGVFIQLIPGVDGLAHVSDLSWTEHIDHPGDIYKKDQEVEAVILAIDADSKKVSLGIKQLSQDPWQEIEEEYPVGKIVEGAVTKITNFGAFVKMPTGIEGLVHISEAEQEGKRIDELLSVGQKREFRVLNRSKTDRKLGLSVRLEASDKDNKVIRSAQPKKEMSQDKPRRDKVEQVPQQPVTKVKSLLQLELEKHVAKKATDDSKE